MNRIVAYQLPVSLNIWLVCEAAIITRGVSGVTSGTADIILMVIASAAGGSLGYSGMVRWLKR